MTPRKKQKDLQPSQRISIAQADGSVTISIMMRPIWQRDYGRHIGRVVAAAFVLMVALFFVLIDDAYVDAGAIEQAGAFIGALVISGALLYPILEEPQFARQQIIRLSNGQVNAFGKFHDYAQIKGIKTEYSSAGYGVKLQLRGGDSALIIDALSEDEARFLVSVLRREIFTPKILTDTDASPEENIAHLQDDIPQQQEQRR